LDIASAGLYRIVNDDEISASTGQGAADRRRKPKPPRCRRKLAFGIFCGIYSAVGKQRLIPVGIENGSAVGIDT